jgi:hypothetical protein
MSPIPRDVCRMNCLAQIAAAGLLALRNPTNAMADLNDNRNEGINSNPGSDEEKEIDEGYSSESEENQNLADEAGGVMSQASERVDTSTGEDKPRKRYVFNDRQKALLEKRVEDRPELKRNQPKLIVVYRRS